MTQSVKENTLVKAKRLTRSSTLDPKQTKKEAKIEILEKQSESDETTNETKQPNAGLIKLKKKVFFIQTPKKILDRKFNPHRLNVVNFGYMSSL